MASEQRSIPEGFYLKTVEHRVRVTRVRQQVVRTEWLVPERYEIGDVLGSGAFGVVVQAHDKVTGENVAIKRVENAFRNPLESKRLLREVKILKHLKHPNVREIDP